MYYLPISFRVNIFILSLVLGFLGADVSCARATPKILEATYQETCGPNCIYLVSRILGKQPKYDSILAAFPKLSLNHGVTVGQVEDYLNAQRIDCVAEKVQWSELSKTGCL